MVKNKSSTTVIESRKGEPRPLEQDAYIATNILSNMHNINKTIFLGVIDMF